MSGIQLGFEGSPRTRLWPRNHLVIRFHRTQQQATDQQIPGCDIALAPSEAYPWCTLGTRAHLADGILCKCNSTTRFVMFPASDVWTNLNLGEIFHTDWKNSSGETAWSQPMSPSLISTLRSSSASTLKGNLRRYCPQISSQPSNVECRRIMEDFHEN